MRGHVCVECGKGDAYIRLPYGVDLRRVQAPHALPPGHLPGP